VRGGAGGRGLELRKAGLLGGGAGGGGLATFTPGVGAGAGERGIDGRGGGGLGGWGARNAGLVEATLGGGGGGGGRLWGARLVIRSTYLKGWCLCCQRRNGVSDDLLQIYHRYLKVVH